ncbi:pentapeptide repeat-containing protein, partial [Fischerella thermalis]
MNIEAIKSGKTKHLAGANLEDEDLSNLDLNRINFAGATLVGTNFTASKLEG